MPSRKPKINRYANGHQRRELRRWLQAQRNPCHICHLPIDYTLPAGDPLAFEVDEVTPVALGGDPLDRHNVAAAHRCCNQWRGKRMTWDPMGAPTRNGGRGRPHAKPRRGQQTRAAEISAWPPTASSVDIHAAIEHSRDWDA